MGMFIETDANKILASILIKLQSDIGETLYSGDERRIFAMAIGALLITENNSIEDAGKQNLLRYARGEVLDGIGEIPACTRIAATYATTTLKFTKTPTVTSAVTIPEGTRVATEDGVVFATTAEATIEKGESTVEVTAQAAEAGAASSGILDGMITKMVDAVPYIESVTNSAITSGGTDAEDDDAYRERIHLAINAYSTAGPRDAYIYHAKSADVDLSDVYIDSPEPDVIHVYIARSDGNLPAEDEIEKVQAKVSAGDIRPLNDQVTTYAPTAEEYDINLKYYVKPDEEAAVVAAVESSGAIESYRLWQDTVIGRNIEPDKLKNLIMNAGAVRADITSPVRKELTPPSLAHFSGTLTVTHEVLVDE